MNIEVIAKIAGVLGFFISVSTFVLTRLERRKKIEIELFESSSLDFPDEEDAKGELLIKVRFTNIGPQPVILKPRTLIIECSGKTYKLDREDYWGMDEFDELMPPTSSQEIGVHLGSVCEALEIESPKNYDEKTFNKLYPLSVKIYDHSGKAYKTEKFKYHESVGEFIT
ncbi:MAG: hypothetical protein VX447_03350 [Pseudomonadota bacterium]|uniref:DUF4352 domain-containing protein n=1 Tax=Gallaecimonas pentaromativorans TaxID=584787 RepID=A0A3N1PAG4_9GAMM|nr:hypothetical protein [Gallaecimonas pentaromativorans]MED5523774.1 hypothetical protein [Pseudomonadota bacterium]ROQ24758.1 hypothetical protein EDC28_1063 [Gallaecimonas pentaromativorans]